MENGNPFRPSEGWDRFLQSEELNSHLWAELLPCDWHYLNFIAMSSVWESRQDGSMILVEFEGNRIIELSADGGLALEYCLRLAKHFGLIPS